jgi:hypothetical protein
MPPSVGSTDSKPSSESAANSSTDPAVDHPPHYGGKDNPYEAIKVIEAWGLGFHLGNTLKYICRQGWRGRQRQPGQALADLKKARWYLDREIQNLERE